jgi:predicted patatin/cPLA2 family phospholipase
MVKRVERYNNAVALIRTPPEGVSVVEICPPESFRVTRLNQDRHVLQEGYEQGRSLAMNAIARWKGMLPG